ncbi:MAG: hypothetical protein V1791_08295, partial [Pseudomonadota bacterium]
GAEFTLSGTAASGVTIQNSQVEQIDDTTFRYYFTGSFGTGEVVVEFQGGTVSDGSAGQIQAATARFTLKEASAILLGPANGGVIDVTGLNGNKYLTVMYVPAPGNRMDEETLNDDDVVFTLTLPGGGTHDVAGPGIPDGAAYRYDLPAGVVFTPGEVTVHFLEGTWSDTGGNANAASTASFTVTGATADVMNPLNGGAIDAALLNTQKYIDIRFNPSGGKTLDPASILDTSSPSLGEFTLISAAASGVIIQNDLVAQIEGTNIFRYPFTGSFGTGTVQIQFIAGSFADDSYTNVTETESFVVLGSTAALAGDAEDGLVGLSVLATLRYIDIAFTGTSGNSITETSIGGDEIKFKMADGQEYDPRGPPSKNADGTFRYFLPDALALEPGVVQVIFQPGAWTDSAGYANLAATASFTIAAPTADLFDPNSGASIDRATLNSRGYILVTFDDATGAGLDESSIIDGSEATGGGAEFTLTGTGAGTVAIQGNAQKVKGDLLFSADDTVDTAFSTALDSQTFSDTLRQTFIDSNVKIAGIVTVTVVTSGSSWQVADAENRHYIIEFAAGVEDAADRIHIYDFNYTFKYAFSGSFVNGPVQVNFLAGRWADKAGNTNLAETENFGIISQAPSFEIVVEGALELHGGGFTPDYDGDTKPDPIFSLRGKVVLNIDTVKNLDTGETLEVRFTLDVSATLELIYLGNIASASGRFILVMGDASDTSTDSSIFGSNKLKFWGVLSLQTNLEKLRAIGIEANAMALLMVNSTGVLKVETISLEGIKGDNLFTIDDSAAVSNIMNDLLPVGMDPNSYIQTIPDSLRQAFTAAGIVISTNLQVQGVEPGTRWKIYDNDANKQYFIDKDGANLQIYGENQTFNLEGKTFSLALAGVLLFKMPPITVDSQELFRM